MRKLVAGVIFKGNHYLILKRKLHWKGWEFVKGNLDGQSFRTALIREIREETGLKKINVISELPRDIIYRHDSIKGHTSSMQKGFLVEANTDKVRTSLEHSEYRWLDAKKAKKLLTHQTHRMFLTLAEKVRRHYKKDLIDKLSHKHATSIKFDGKYISLKYDGKKLRCLAIKKKVKDIGLWAKKKNTVYYDKNLTELSMLPILVHEVIEKYVSQTYGLDENKEAHKVATAVEKEFVVDPQWISQQRKVAAAWVKANHQKIGKSKFF